MSKQTAASRPTTGAARQPERGPSGRSRADSLATAVGAPARASGPTPAGTRARGGLSPTGAAARVSEPAPVRANEPTRAATRARGESKPAARPTRARESALADVSGPATPPASGCAAVLTAQPTLQFERTRTTLREFSWSDMARFFETSLEEAEPAPIQVASAHTIPADEAIRRSGLPARTLEPLARAQAVDLLSERDLTRVAKTLATATPAGIEWLLRADSPTLRAHVWNWLATTPAGVCALARIDGRLVDAAIRDRSVAVEHGEDLVFRPLGDYALQARARLATAAPPAFDALLRALWAEPEIDPRVRALVAGLRVRRGHPESIELGLRDPTAAVRGATAAAALDRDRTRYEERMLAHAADDPADLVTELIVGELLGGPDGVPQGPLAAARDERVATALSRWRGHGDPLAPLPTPAHPLRVTAPKFEAAPPPVSEAMFAEAPAPVPVTPAPAPAPEPAPVIAEAPSPAPSSAIVPEPPPAAAEPPAEPRPLAHGTTTTKHAPEPGPRLPSVLDDPAEGIFLP